MANPTTAEAGPEMLLADMKRELPATGLFQDKAWRIGDRPLTLTSEIYSSLQRTGEAIVSFLKAVNELYYSRDPSFAFFRKLLDQGKPEWIREINDSEIHRDALPKVIRPDLLLSDDKLRMSEIDSLPGGIGTIDFLNQFYSERGFDVIRGSRSFGEYFRESEIRFVFSEEALDYRPEIQWMLENAGAPLDEFLFLESEMNVSDLGNFDGASLYRYFELWDRDLTPAARAILEKSNRGELTLTPPPKAFFEEKMLLSLYWDPFLRDHWKSVLSIEMVETLDELIPFGWVIYPQEIPPHAIIPGLGISSFEEMKQFSQKERRLVLKISGFSETAWGSRGVYIGHDLSAEEWGEAVDTALDSFPANPYMMQEFKASDPVLNRYLSENGDVIEEPGVVRLSPYYLAEDGHVELQGVLATVCPPDKKKIHGMSDATFVPCML